MQRKRGEREKERSTGDGRDKRIEKYRERKHPTSTPCDDFKIDVTKYIRLVPPFQERNFDKYFCHFEKNA